MSFNLKELFGEKLVSKSGEVNTTEALENKDAIAIYFSAHWCPPCRGFTPVFAEKYTKLKEAGKSFECIFASSDQDEKAFTDYYKDMPWLALPYSERKLKETLATKYKCNGIPYLVIIDGKTGETITTNGRGGVSGTNFIEDFPYHPKAMYDLSESMDGITEGLSLLIIQDYSDADTKKKNSDLLLNIAKENKEFGKFFTANGGGPVGFVRGELKLPKVVAPHEHELKSAEGNCWACDGCRKPGPQCKERYRCIDCDFDHCENCIVESKKEIEAGLKAPNMAILDIANKSYYKPVEGFGDVNEVNILKMIDDKKADKLTKTPLASEE